MAEAMSSGAGGEDQGPSALPALSLTFCAARSAFALLANASPDEATISPLPAFRRHRYLPAESA
jgi:hypothetical protein